MKTIKFRVWYPREKKFYYTDSTNQYATLGKDAWDEEHEICLFTGLKDKNNKEIYEGDLIKVKFYENWTDKEGYYSGPHEVWYCENSAMFKYGNKLYGSPFLKDVITQTLEMEVIGNIFEK